MRNLILIVAALVASVSGRISLAEGPTTRPTLHIVGDSTVHNGTRGQLGWGEPLIPMMDATKIKVVNDAIGGRSSRSFIDEGRWDKVLATLNSGDYVILQFGHNDGGPLAGDNRERGSIRGIGDETQEVTLTLAPNAGKKMTIHTYGWYLRKYASDAKGKGATLILCSPIPHCPRPGERVELPAKPGGYPLWAQRVAEAEHIPFIDLDRIIRQKWIDNKLTAEALKQTYFTSADFTHTSPEGAKLNAEAVIEGLMLLDLPLKDARKK